MLDPGGDQSDCTQMMEYIFESESEHASVSESVATDNVDLYQAELSNSDSVYKSVQSHLDPAISQLCLDMNRIMNKLDCIQNTFNRLESNQFGQETAHIIEDSVIDTTNTPKRCHRCDSTDHLVRMCPFREEAAGPSPAAKPRFRTDTGCFVTAAVSLSIHSSTTISKARIPVQWHPDQE